MKRIVLMLIVMVSFVYSNAQRILQTDTVRAKKVSADTVKASVFVGLPVLDTSHFASKDTTDALNLRILANNNSIAAHIANVSNPHAVTLQQLTAVGKTTTDSLTVATGTGKMFIVGNNSALPRPQLELDAKSQVFQPFGANGGGSYQGLRAGNPATYLGLRYNGSNGTPTPITGGDLVSYYGGSGFDGSFLNSARGYIGWQVPGSSVWTTLSQPMKGVLYTTPTGSTIAVLRVTYKEDGDIMFHNYLKPRSDGDTRKALYTTTDGTLQLGDVETDYWDVMWSIPTYDSTADLGTYINAAFNNSKGIKNIRFPGKTFSGTAITVPKDIRITGDGNTVIKSMNSSGPAISVAGDNVSIKNIRINGNNIGNVGLLVSKSSNVLADNVEVYNVTGSSAKAIFVDSSFHVTFNRLDIHNIGSGPDSISRGLYASNGGFIIVANSKLDGKGMPWADGDLVHFHTDSTAAGFYSDFHGIIEKNDFINTPKRAVKVQASTVIVKDNYIVSTATDPYFCPLVGIEGFGDRITIKNNYINFLRGTIGIDMTNAVQGILDGNTINVDSAKNYPFGRAGTGTLTGMFFTNTKKMIVINNMIFAHNAGIRFVSDTGSAARANRIYNADTALSTLNSRKVTIDNNDLMSDVGMIALHITTSTTTDSLRVIGNHYKGATVTIPPATIANSRIWGNDWNPDPADLTSAQTLDAKTFTNVAKIGIGTTGTELLEVQGNTTGNVISKVTNTNTTGGARAIQKLIANTVILSNQAIVGDAGYNGTESSHPYILTTAGQNRVYISSAGGVAIGSSAPAASAQLDIPSTSKGILIPRMTDTQMNAISSPASGLQVINTTYNNRPFWYNGTSWVYSPRVSSGTAAPATTPTLVGDTYIDTTNKKMYVATGNSSSADWTITN